MKKRWLGVVLTGALVVSAYVGWSPRVMRWEKDERVVFHDDKLDIVHTGEIEDATLATLSKDDLFAGEGRFFYHAAVGSTDLGAQRNLLQPSSLTSRVRDLVARSRFVRGLRKIEGPNNAMVLGSGTILVFFDQVYRSTDGGETFEPVHSLVPPNPVSDRYGAEATPSGDVYFGELIFAKDPHPVRVYKGTDDGRTWEVQYTFPPGDIDHVHGIVYDKFRDRLWICTGDDAETSKLYYTDDDFRTVKLLGGGDEGWRIMGLIPTKDTLFWGSDGEPEGANIYRYDFSTARRTLVQKVGNPIWLATQLADGTMVLGSSYEPHIPYTAEKSPPKEAALYVSRDGNAWYKTLTFAYRPDAPGLNAVLGLSRSNAQHRALYVSPSGPLEKAFTLQRYEIRWHDEAVGASP